MTNPQEVVIVDATGTIDPEFLYRAAAAIHKHVTLDLTSIWSHVNARVTAVPSLDALPEGSWPVLMLHQSDLPDGAGGVHLDEDNQPFAKVAVTADASWTIDACHEIDEMLIDPTGNRLKVSRGIEISQDGTDVVDGEGLFHYLVEACDPCEDAAFAYEIDGIAVSDFITPHFYDSVVVAGRKYSFTGAIERPRQLLKGGYISFENALRQWQQILWLDQRPQLVTLDMSGERRSLREAVHQKMGDEVNDRKRAIRRGLGRMRNGMGQHVAFLASQRQTGIEARRDTLRRRYHLS
jgi:hypothetical protein